MQVLDSEKQRVIQLQSALVLQEDFYLAGGTGLGLRLGHRLSRDLDWFTARQFDASKVGKALERLPEKPTELSIGGPGTLRAYYGRLETSFIHYQQVVARPQIIDAAGLKIPVADLETLALMKASALQHRGAKRDFIDIHALCKAPGWSMERFIDLATTRLPLKPVQMKLALTYHADADRDPMPPGYKIPWDRVKADLQRDVMKWERGRSRGLDR